MYVYILNLLACFKGRPITHNTTLYAQCKKKSYDESVCFVCVVVYSYIQREWIDFDIFHVPIPELDEDWYHSEDPVNAGVTFYVKVYCTGITAT